VQLRLKIVAGLLESPVDRQLVGQAHPDSRQLDASGHFDMFRRAKLRLSAIDSDSIRQATKTASAIQADLSVSERRGEPLRGAVRPPALRWHLAAEDERT